MHTHIAPFLLFKRHNFFPPTIHCGTLRFVCVVICQPPSRAADDSDMRAAAMHSGSIPRWLRPCRSAEEVPPREISRNFGGIGVHNTTNSHNAKHTQRHYQPANSQSDTSRSFPWLWQTVGVKMGLIWSPFP